MESIPRQDTRVSGVEESGTGGVRVGGEGEKLPENGTNLTKQY